MLNPKFYTKWTIKACEGAEMISELPTFYQMKAIKFLFERNSKEQVMEICKRMLVQLCPQLEFVLFESAVVEMFADDSEITPEFAAEYYSRNRYIKLELIARLILKHLESSLARQNKRKKRE
jgi:oligoendopeptidase F